jgi:hypothetical protein
MKGIVGETFGIFFIITVATFAPSAGLITLAVPDEPYGSAINVPDSQHVGKRTFEDSEHFAFDASFATFNIHPRIYVLDEVASAQQNGPQNTLVSFTQIRAPPDKRLA